VAVGKGLRRLSGVWCALVCAAALATAVPAEADTPPELGPWRFERHTVGIFTRSQGIATDPDEPGVTLYSWQLGLEWSGPGGHAFRRLMGTPLQLLLDGYLHIGDVDSHGGLAYIPYENSGKGTEKAYGVIDLASGRVLRWSVHPLDAGEAYNNSWVSVSPDGRWLVSGEWEDMTSLLVFATDDVGRPSIETAFRVRLDAPLSYVQGCDFYSAVRLVCHDDTDDRRLLQIDLDHPLDGADVGSHTVVLGSTPVDLAVPLLANICRFATEAEGVDVSGSTLRFMTVDPCLLWSHEYVYTLAEP